MRVMYIFPTDLKISKLSHVGVKALRAGSFSEDAYQSIVCGNYRFGTVKYCEGVPIDLLLFILVFMSPETATTSRWRKLFKDGTIGMVAIDEAHCISEWLVVCTTIEIAYTFNEQLHVHVCHYST